MVNLNQNIDMTKMKKSYKLGGVGKETCIVEKDLTLKWSTARKMGAINNKQAENLCLGQKICKHIHLGVFGFKLQNQEPCSAN